MIYSQVRRPTRRCSCRRTAGSQHRGSLLAARSGDSALAVSAVPSARTAHSEEMNKEISMSGCFGATSTTDDVLAGRDLSGKRVLVTGVSACRRFARHRVEIFVHDYLLSHRTQAAVATLSACRCVRMRAARGPMRRPRTTGSTS
jgi:hypothetical protein